MEFSTYNYSISFYVQTTLIVLATLTLKLSVSLWGHSGQGKPPMFGDFEAQRHWMEITVNLPAEDWYKDTKDNDLQYWGLDYPPLTAYHMMINGKIARYINPDFVKLGSKGMEDPPVKIFMRMTVLAMDLLLFLPTAIAFFMYSQSKKIKEKDILIQITMLVGYPGLILIDNGHFQYNNVSLSLFILATLAFTKKEDILGSLLFCLALNYKQMELYHALPFFAYLFGALIQQKIAQGITKFISLSSVVALTFLALWLPFISSADSILSVIHRLFPVKRGLYEDKVANVWCAASIIIKFKEIFSQSDMAIICLVTTTICLLPSFLHLIQNPTIQHLHYALINAALVFFLFSFHVHEKTILLAVIPAILVLKSDPLIVVWFMLISVFSMLPLLIKDGLLLPTVATVGLFWIISTHYVKPTKNVSSQMKLAFELSLLAASCISLATIIIPPPARYPDLFSLMIAIFSCLHFSLFALFFHLKQFDIDIYDFNDSRKLSKAKTDEVSYSLRHRNTANDVRNRQRNQRH
ncbi:dolichyl pyrophosphate Man9GlcNAc2 alpha-1 3-glucosyltransferase isoform X1 [Biomphalaria glabrata]|nr:putative dolichyl pyrophosphate Man9GlcNAc2 alpha-1; 3-glucosyltransferase isoform X1 [Biomphalaria glabrata]